MCETQSRPVPRQHGSRAAVWTGVAARTAFVFVLSSSSLHLAHAQGTLVGDNQACSVDQPCFNGAYQNGNTVVFQFTATGSWDFYNVRYAQEGGGETQVENKSGSFTFRDTKPNRVYKISVQGCNTHTLAHSTCTDWSQASVTTAPEEKTGSISTPVVRQPPPPRVPVKAIGRVNRQTPAPVPPVETAALVNAGPLTPSQLELEDQGSHIVSADTLLSAMRDLEPEGPRRLGFDIGVATGADQTLWGPGKQAMIDSLPDTVKTSAERSAHFVVARNANAKFASDGARVADGETRAEVIAARSAEPAGYYTLGFDIGAGIFASLPRGGAGHTLPGPGSASIRNSLPPPGTRGFDAASLLYMGK